jgi:hypothetical protein
MLVVSFVARLGQQSAPEKTLAIVRRSRARSAIAFCSHFCQPRVKFKQEI